MASTSTRLPPLPALRDFIYMYKLQAKKILSQNYLMDMNLTRKIAKKSNFKPGDHVIEIGPGPGGITRAILENGCGRLDVVELDSRFLPPLEHLKEAAPDRLFIHQGDCLKTDLGDIIRSGGLVDKRDWFDDCPNAHIIGNLPFNVASPLIIKYLKEMSRRQGAWKYGRVPLTLTFQLEVAKRLCGEIDSEFRSRLSIVTQYITQPKLLFVIPGACFVPKPEVDVGVVNFIPRIEPLIPCDFSLVEKVARHIFLYRQKYVIKCIKRLYPDDSSNDMAHDILRKCRIDPTITSYKLGIDEIASICILYEKQCHELPGLFLYDHAHCKKPLDELALLDGAIPPKYITINDIQDENLDQGIRLSKFIENS